MDCVFCKIAAKDIPSTIIYEDGGAVAFLDIHPRSPGHAVVVPRAHAETILDLTVAAAAKFFEAARKTTELLRVGLAPDGFTLGINHGKVAGQEVEHLHFHIIPRFKADGGSSLQSVVNNPPKESLQEIAQKINDKLSSEKFKAYKAQN